MALTLPSRPQVLDKVMKVADTLGDISSEPLMNHSWRISFPKLSYDAENSNSLKVSKTRKLLGNIGVSPKTSISYDGESVMKVSLPLSELSWTESKKGLYTVITPSEQKFNSTMSMTCGINQYTLSPVEYFQTWKELEVTPEGFKGLPGDYYKVIKIVLRNKFFVPRITVDVLCCPKNWKFSTNDLIKTANQVEPVYLNVDFNICYISLTVGLGL